MTIYLAPEDEIHAQCQSYDADSCFDPSTNTINLVGNPPTDGTPVEEIAAHEYGHAITFARLNGWGLAYNLGPEYWASYENVCARTEQGSAFPGDEGSHYSQNPGEAWADTNGMLNGGSPNLCSLTQASSRTQPIFDLRKRTSCSHGLATPSTRQPAASDLNREVAHFRSTFQTTVDTPASS